jgi:hypothetical protein
LKQFFAAADEPKIGGTSGLNVSQFIQEATVEYQLGSAVWLDAGIFFARIGDEGRISRDSPLWHPLSEWSSTRALWVRRDDDGADR